jgi:type I restriction enzyme M protein
MPSNIFATTGTNVSILFLDATNKGKVILIDASNLGEKVKEGKNQKTLLSTDEEKRIIDTFNSKTPLEDFSIVVGYDEIEAKNYSLSAGQYFDVKVEHIAMTHQQFEKEFEKRTSGLTALFLESHDLENKVRTQLSKIKYD